MADNILDDFQGLLVVKDVVKIKLCLDMVPKSYELSCFCFGEVVDKLRAALLLVLQAVMVGSGSRLLDFPDNCFECDRTVRDQTL